MLKDLDRYGSSLGTMLKMPSVFPANTINCQRVLTALVSDKQDSQEKIVMHRSFARTSEIRGSLSIDTDSATCRSS
jgi:hypothetical protein